MKKIFGLIFALASFSMATVPSLYLHHERSTQAAIEADCQNREVCLDKINLAPMGRFQDGTLFHLISQEKPNVNLTGSFSVTGAAVLSNNLTLSLIPTGRIPYTTTGGLVTSAAAFGFNGTTFTAPATTLSEALVFGSAGTGGTFRLFKSAGAGLVMRGGAGSSYDLALMDAAGGYLIRNPTGTTLLEFSGSGISIAGTALTTGVHTFTAAPVFSSATASQAVFTNGSKALISNAITGSGNVVMSASPTLTGTITAAAISASGTVTADSIISTKFYAEGTFTCTATGLTTSPTGTASWVRVGKSVTLLLPMITGTSNSISFTYTGLPAAIQPPAAIAVPLSDCENANTYETGTCSALLSNSGTITFRRNTSDIGWTNSATTKGLSNIVSSRLAITYTLQ